MEVQKIIADKIDIYNCPDCPFYSFGQRFIESMKVMRSAYSCRAYKGWPLNFRTRPKPDFCKIKRIEIYEEEEGG